jgi:hypothetical protein
VPALYVYGFAPAGGPRLDLSAGVGGATVSAFRSGEIAAIVSPVEAAFVGRARDARAHEEVLRSALAQRNSVLPLRFGTVFDGLDDLEARLLAPEQARLESLLEELVGKVEFQLRGLYHDEEAVLRELVSSDGSLSRLRERALGSGGYMAQVELGEAVVAAFERRRATDAAFLRDRLAPLALDVSERSELPDRVAAHLAFLVARKGAASFESAAEGLAEELQGKIVLRLTGPLPAYTFVAFELESAGTG